MSTWQPGDPLVPDWQPGDPLPSVVLARQPDWQPGDSTWQPGDPIYDTELSCRVTPVLSDPCPPGCWHYCPDAHGYGMRWTPATPALQFLPWRGLSVTEPEFDVNDPAAWRSA